VLKFARLLQAMILYIYEDYSDEYSRVLASKLSGLNHHLLKVDPHMHDYVVHLFTKATTN
jgi:hypothetical protein